MKWGTSSWSNWPSIELGAYKAFLYTCIDGRYEACIKLPEQDSVYIPVESEQDGMQLVIREFTKHATKTLAEIAPVLALLLTSNTVTQ